MKLSSESHLFGETIAEHGFPLEYDELISVLGGLELPLRPAEPFTVQGRPATPKRQMKRIGGQRKYSLFPVDQGQLNQLLHDRLRDAGWTAEPGWASVLGGKVRDGRKRDVQTAVQDGRLIRGD